MNEQRVRELVNKLIIKSKEYGVRLASGGTSIEDMYKLEDDAFEIKKELMVELGLDKVDS